MSPDTEPLAGIGAEAGDLLHLIGVWVCLTVPLAGFGATLVETLSIAGLSALGGGLLFGTLVVATLEVADRRPSLGTSGMFCLTYLVLSVATIAFAGPFVDTLGPRLGETAYFAGVVGLAALLTFTRYGARVWAAGARLTRRLLRLPVQKAE